MEEIRKYADLRHLSMTCPKGFSHANILMTLMPDIISFMARILSSVLRAVFILRRENALPIQPVENTSTHSIIIRLLQAAPGHVRIERLTLQRNEENEDTEANQAGWPDYVKQDDHADYSLDWTNPEVVQEQNKEVEAVHIIRKQVHNLAYCCLAQSFLAQLQALLREHRGFFFLLSKKSTAMKLQNKQVTFL